MNNLVTCDIKRENIHTGLYDFPSNETGARVELLTYVSSLNKFSPEKVKSTGYVRAKIFKSSLLFRILIDSGNHLENVIVSKSFAVQAQLCYIPVNMLAGTATDKKGCKIVGRCPEIIIQIENIPGTIVLRNILIIENLSHCLNLGEAWLRANNASLNFGAQLCTLNIGQACTTLANKKIDLLMPYADARFQRILNKFHISELKNLVNGTHEFVDLSVNSMDRDTLVAHDPGLTYAYCFAENDTVKLRCDSQVLLQDEILNIVPTHFCLPSSRKHPVCVLVEGRGGENSDNTFAIMSGVYEAKFLPQSMKDIQSGRTRYSVDLGLISKSKNDFALNKNQILGSVNLIQPVFDGEDVEVVPDVGEVCVNHVERDGDSAVKLLSADSPKKDLIDFISKSLHFNERLDWDQNTKNRLLELFMRHIKCLSLHEHDYGRTNAMELVLKLKPNAKLKSGNVRPMNPAQKAAIDEQVDAWLEAGIIGRATTDFVSSVVLVRKKLLPGETKQKTRLCIDYRNLNDNLVGDAFPLPNIQENLECLNAAQLYSTLDLKAGYNALKVHEDSQKLTSFVCHRGTFLFKFAGFGIKTIPSVFSKLMKKMLDTVPEWQSFCLCYLDDVLVFDKHFEDHMKHLDQILSAHENFGLKLNLKKCEFFKSEVKYLGYMVSKKGIGMVPEYLEKIQNYPIDQIDTGKKLARFLGLVGYYRTFIREFSVLTAEFNQLKGCTVVKLSDLQKDKLRKLLDCFMKADIRAFPDWSDSAKPFVLKIDASAIAFGAILCQEQRGRERIIACWSKVCNSHEQKYSSLKSELCALVYALKKFEHLLMYRKFIVHTDSRGLQYFRTLKSINSVMYRWIAYLELFDFHVVYIKGKFNTVPDLLSRTIYPLNREDKRIEKEVLGDELNHLKSGRGRELSRDVTGGGEDFSLKSEIKGDLKISHLRFAAKQLQSLKLWRIESLKDYDISKLMEIVYNQDMVSKEVKRAASSYMGCYLRRLPFLYTSNGLLWLWDSAVPRICVPLKLQFSISAIVHNFGHSGVSETLNRLKKFCYFPFQHLLVEKIVQNCVICIQKERGILRNKKRHANYTAVYGEVLKLCFMDSVGPLAPCMYKGVKCEYVLTLLDSFSRYFFAFPIKDLTAETVTNAIVQNIFIKYGSIGMIKTDNFPSFKSEYFVTNMRNWGCNVDYIVKYNPQSNHVERLHSDMNALLKGFCGGDPFQWAKYLDFVVYVMNIATTSQRGCSPFEIMYGRVPLLSLNILFPSHGEQNGGDRPKNVSEYALRFQKLRQEIAKRLGSGGIHHSKGHLGIKYAQELSIGDTVYYFDSNVKSTKYSKFKHMWIGPFEIAGCVDECTYLIRPVGDWFTGRASEFSASRVRLRKVDSNYAAPFLQQKIDIVDISHRAEKLAREDADYIPVRVVNEKEGAERVFVDSNMNNKNDNVSVEILPGGGSSADIDSNIKKDQIHMSQQNNLKNKNNEITQKEFGLGSQDTKNNVPCKFGRSAQSLLRRGGGEGDGQLTEGNGELPLGRRAARAARAALRALLRRGKGRRS